ncbi:DNA mismatch repair protein MutH [Aerococcus urinaehominis]|uniref:Sau3AI family type II restriction endonuclease n=1 Tax=Aerococcus urinaehominis TaxID=128944 RepID=UPI00088EC64A|nr:Sau3AI family type II restriction endonuclease [Aerococcus urinaehominis]SDL82217.1 DNA mismatch repair protein MutH [Aerococcus urinaehominis]
MTDYLLPYDETDPKSIYHYAEKLKGKNFVDILANSAEIVSENLDDVDYLTKQISYYNNPRSKGGLGNLVEKYYFGFEPNSSPLPDFEEAGLELKLTPYKKNKNGTYSAKERLVIGMIPYDRPVPNSFEDSHVKEKLNLVLFLFYEFKKELARTQYTITHVQLFHLFSEVLSKDLEIIIDDYNKIIEKIKAGKAHELSEGDTMYLGACTKGATAKKSEQPQFYNKEIKAKRRAYSLKQGYMTSFLNNYVFKGIDTYQSIGESFASQEDFEKEVLAKIERYKGYSRADLVREFDLENITAKNLFSVIAMRILGITSSHAEEFTKSNTLVKTIRVEENNTIRENMSLSNINFREFVNTEWEDSDIYEYFETTRFLFVVFKNDGEDYCLSHAVFWHMPAQDLNGPLKQEWLANQQIIRNGIKFSLSGKRIFNNLPTAQETKISHLRPRAAQSAYKIAELNIERGNIEKDADQLPNGDYMTRQAFWLNKSYIGEIIELDNL